MSASGGGPGAGRRLTRLGDLRSAAAFAVLLPAATLAGHELGYLVAHLPGSAGEAAVHVHDDGFHGYVPTLRAVVEPLGVAAIVVLALRQVRRGGTHPDLRAHHLAVPQLLLYGAVEAGERLPHGALWTLPTEPAVWAGLPAQVLVACLVALFVRWVGGLVVTGAVGAPGVARPGRLERRPQAPPARRRGWCPLSRRGPPVVLAT